MAVVRSLRRDGGLIARVPNRLEDVLDGATVRIEAKLSCPDANVVDLETLERLQGPGDASDAVAARHPGDGEMEGLHASS